MAYEDCYTIKTKSGDSIKMVRSYDHILSNRLCEGNSEQERNTLFCYKLYNQDDDECGCFQMQLLHIDELNIVYAEVYEKYRGRGYTTAAVEQCERIAKANGVVKITAELANNAPDVHHIMLDKQGYVKIGEIKTKDMLELWCGLTLVEKQI